ncbi:hypothetical protein TNCV_2761231 [Trichonephila clavipes]|nr:hypothetical protein TNCV_2761231 [Trichonephila clavipes]
MILIIVRRQNNDCIFVHKLVKYVPFTPAHWKQRDRNTAGNAQASSQPQDTRLRRKKTTQFRSSDIYPVAPSSHDTRNHFFFCSIERRCSTSAADV